MLAVGDDAPAFSLPDLNGNTHSLAELPKRPMLVALYKAGCPVCQLTLPYLERIANGGLQIVAISQDAAPTTTAFANKFGIGFSILLDGPESGYAVSNAFGISHVPSLFLIESDGKISHAGAGFSKTEMEALGARAGVPLFRPDEDVPAWKPG